jgi:aspartate ammonia-lyase
MRLEKDFLGEVEIPAEAMYGIHSVRAVSNFPFSSAFHQEWYKAIGLVKMACYITYRNFKTAAKSKFKLEELSIPFMEDSLVDALEKAALRVSTGESWDHFIVPAIQGGAGTSINMNVNEIISNLALKELDKPAGSYEIIDPIEHANIYQSTNDVIPTSLKITSMQLLNELEEKINELRFSLEKLETEHRQSLRIGYTQMQQAVPSTYGMLFSTYNEALSRDWWRVSKCFERIKVVNIGGSAIGTGVAVPRYFIMEVVQTLQKLSKLPVTRSENMPDATNNLDSFVEVHAILKSHAVNLEKMVNDIRLLAADLIGEPEIEIPQLQVGSSIMPGKVNPVLPEFIISSVHKIYANDQLISSLSAQGCLDLNAYLPVIGNALLESLKLLIACNISVKDKLIDGLKVNKELAEKRLYSSPAITTVLSPLIGYHKAAELAKAMKEHKCDVYEANRKVNILEQERLTKQLEVQNLLKMGFSLNDL